MVKGKVRKFIHDELANDSVSSSYVAAVTSASVALVEQAFTELEREGIVEKEPFGGGNHGWRKSRVTDESGGAA